MTIYSSPAVQRNTRTLSFSPILARAASNLIGASESGVEISSQDDENGFISRFHDFNRINLSPGHHDLEVARKHSWQLISTLRAREQQHLPRRVSLYEWTSHEVMMVTTNALYGSKNPFRHPENRAAWHVYQSGLTQLMSGFMPSLLSRRYIRAREKLDHAPLPSPSSSKPPLFFLGTWSR
ncbi:hypothetical protein GGR57DRAFT_386191 [Xylariaceae sp. FL1272]|nr:hypothetical protein GGR57DRAFT_386191 [Xylariaceae sp. FL1272]